MRLRPWQAFLRLTLPQKKHRMLPCDAFEFDGQAALTAKEQPANIRVIQQGVTRIGNGCFT